MSRVVSRVGRAAGGQAQTGFCAQARYSRSATTTISTPTLCDNNTPYGVIRIGAHQETSRSYTNSQFDEGFRGGTGARRGRGGGCSTWGLRFPSTSICLWGYLGTRSVPARALGRRVLFPQIQWQGKVCVSRVEDGRDVFFSNWPCSRNCAEMEVWSQGGYGLLLLGACSLSKLA